MFLSIKFDKIFSTNMPERPNTLGLERENNVAKIERFIEQVTATYRAENIPIGIDGRINMRAYAGIHFDLEKDLARNREYDREWFGDVSEAQILEKRRQREGEQLEMLAYGIFIKNLTEEFVVARASSHDDRANKVDTVILDRKTGAIICAFDEVGDTMGIDYEKKQALVRDYNLKGGASLKYGIGIVEKDKKKIITLSSVANIPLFYIALPSDRIKKGMKEFMPDPGNQSEFEEKLFIYFVAIINAQIQALELYSRRLDPNLKKKLEAFKRIMSSLGSGADRKRK